MPGLCGRAGKGVHLVDRVSTENRYALRFAEQQPEPLFFIIFTTVHVLFYYRLGHIH